MYEEGTAIIGADNRGLRFGDGLFETMKMVDGKLQLQDEHFARLWRGMLTLGFSFTKHFAPENIINDIVTVANKNNHQHAARVRITVVRGDGGLYDAENDKPNYIVQTWALPQQNIDNFGWNENGLDIGFYEQGKKSCDVLSNIKTNNCLVYAMAAKYAKANQWNEALILNNFDRVCESTIANVFIIKMETIVTPPLSEGCVAGVMRASLIAQLKKDNWQIIEEPLTKEDVMNADEIFLSNSISNIRWVKSLNDKTYSNKLAIEINKELLPKIFM